MKEIGKCVHHWKQNLLQYNCEKPVERASNSNIKRIKEPKERLQLQWTQWYLGSRKTNENNQQPDLKKNQLKQFPLALNWNFFSLTGSKFSPQQVMITQYCALNVQFTLTIWYWDGAIWSSVVPGVRRCTLCWDRHSRGYSSIKRRTDLFVCSALNETCLCIKSVYPGISQKLLAFRFLGFPVSMAPLLLIIKDLVL